MIFGHVDKFQTRIPSQNIDDFQSNSEEQQLGNRFLSVNEGKRIIYNDPQARKKPSKQQSSFIDDLIRMIQVSLIIALLVFIGIMCCAIFNEVREFWFQTQARSVSDIDKTNEPIIKMQLTPDEILINEAKLQNAEQQSIPSEIKQSEPYKNQQGIALKQDPMRDIKESTIETQQVKQGSEIKIANNQNAGLQKRSDQKQQQSVSLQAVKQAMTQNDKYKDIQLSPQVNNLDSTKDNSLNRVSADTTNAKGNTQQVYDPVLIQMNIMRKKSGKRFRDSIYTMKGTQISEHQYNMARQLIQITQYYNPKQGKFEVSQRSINSQQCSSSSLLSQQQCIHKKQSQIQSIIEHEKAYYTSRYKEQWRVVKQRQQQQLAFCIVVPSYRNNHADNIFRNLNSIFQQQYLNYHVIYIDDHSQDGTSQKVQQYRTMYGINQQQLELHVNQQNQRALSNIYKAAHSYCKSKEIMIIVDGDDYLIGTQVLSLLNYQYQTKRLLAAYTNYLRINQPYYVKVGTSTPYPKTIVDKRTFRKNYNIFRASHLRSFYVDLFRKIKPQDLQDSNHHFFTAANDFAIMMPILEMSSPHVQYIPELTYLYDSGTGLNNFQSKKGVQAANAKIISKRNIYPSVDINQFYEASIEDKK